MTRQILTFLILSPFSFANAQSVISTDSIAIFRTDQDNAILKASICTAFIVVGIEVLKQ